MKTRVVYVINYIKNGGPSNVIRNIISNLAPDEYEATILTLFPEKNECAVVQELRNAGVKVIQCKSLSRAGCLLGQDKEFRQLIEKGRYDVIHTHGMIPDVLSSRLKTDAVRISTIHNNMFEDYLTAYGKFKSKVYSGIHLHCLAKLDYQVCCSKSVYDALHKYLTNGSYVRNGIGDTVIKQPITREQLGMDNRDILYIYVGHLEARKNVVWLLEQFQKTHNANEHLLVLGKGSTEAACRKIEDPNIHIIGFSTNAAAYLAMSDVYVSASMSEGFSMAVLEALDNGLALLLSDIPSHHEVFEIEKGVYLGEKFSFTDKSFENAMNQLRKHYQQVDRKKIKEVKTVNLSAKNMTERYKAYYAKKKER